MPGTVKLLLDGKAILESAALRPAGDMFTRSAVQSCRPAGRMRSRWINVRYEEQEIVITAWGLADLEAGKDTRLERQLTGKLVTWHWSLRATRMPSRARARTGHRWSVGKQNELIAAWRRRIGKPGGSERGRPVEHPW